MLGTWTLESEPVVRVYNGWSIQAHQTQMTFPLLSTRILCPIVKVVYLLLEAGMPSSWRARWLPDKYLVKMRGQNVDIGRCL